MRNSTKEARYIKYSIILREKNKIKSSILISNKNLINKLYSLLILTKSKVSILSRKGISKVREITNLRYINK